MGKCLNCGDELISKYKYRKKYCSKDCQYSYNREKAISYGKKRYYEKVRPLKILFQSQTINCKNCNKLFNTKTHNHTFCSKECWIQYHSTEYNSFLRLRFEIFKRDNFLCQYCGRSPKRDKCKLVIDHINPIANGGNSDIDNLITSCEECNLGKSDILLEERQLNKKEVKNE